MAPGAAVLVVGAWVRLADGRLARVTRPCGVDTCTDHWIVQVVQRGRLATGLYRGEDLLLATPTDEELVAWCIVTLGGGDA